MSKHKMITSASPNTPRVSRDGFTLVELLVVIGIIALLISILLPALSSARQAALKVACAAKLKTVMLAATLHLSDHHGYYPLAGLLPGTSAPSLDDAYSQKYDYGSESGAGTGLIQPMTVSLAGEMSAHGLNALSNTAIGQSETDAHGWVRNFYCPAQATDLTDFRFGNTIPILYYGPNVYYVEAESYVFNEYVCGWDSSLPASGVPFRLQGRASGIRQVASTIFAADGLPGGTRNNDGPLNMMTFSNGAQVAPLTLADAYRGLSRAYDPVVFDKMRHRGKINIVFCDGHVEAKNITLPDLGKVFIAAP